jgi:endonuclease-3
VKPRARTESAADRIARAARIAAGLAKLYPQARISLNFKTPWQCLVATVLSAQCTDQRVNQVTPTLFKEVPDLAAMDSIPVERLQRMIVTTGFFRMKARSLKGAARVILERFGGEIPDRMEDLVTIPGVGRKTANVILGHVFGRPGMVVDTHVRRLARRMGFTRNADPVKIEADLQKLMPAAQWTPFSMRLILHGRNVCLARRPRCAECTLSGDCPRVGVPSARAV